MSLSLTAGRLAVEVKFSKTLPAEIADLIHEMSFCNKASISHHSLSSK